MSDRGTGGDISICGAPSLELKKRWWQMADERGLGRCKPRIRVTSLHILYSISHKYGIFKTPQGVDSRSRIPVKHPNCALVCTYVTLRTVCAKLIPDANNFLNACRCLWLAIRYVKGLECRA